MINKTKDYAQFVFRSDNRQQINQPHIKKLIESIRLNNLLPIRPIVVNENMEVLDGQHRLLAAKELGLDIYYQMQPGLCAQDIVKMNITLNWQPSDFLNFYCNNGYTEYKKLKEFMIKNQLDLRLGLGLSMGTSDSNSHKFKMGQYVFEENITKESLEICTETTDFLKKMNGYHAYIQSCKFWRAMIKLFRHPDFEVEKWRSNVQRMITYFGPRTSGREYLKMVFHVYNYRLVNKIPLSGEL